MTVCVLILAAGGTAVALLAPAGWGSPAVIMVTDGHSARTYQEVVAAVADTPGWLSALAAHLPALGLLVLLLLLAWTGWTGWRQHTPRGVGALLVLAGTVLAYGLSEALKLVVDQGRPCRAFGELTIWEHCPPVGDLSFPSNHSTVAGALATGLVLLAPRLALVAVPTAIVVAAMRVVAGVHYPHDVLAGLLLGATITAALLVALAPRNRTDGGRYWV